MTRPTRVPFGASLLALAMFGASLAHADALFSVDTTADLIDDNTADGLCRTSAGNCSLRTAIMQSNHLPGIGFVTIRVPAGIYRITRPIPANGNNDEQSGDFNLAPPQGPNQTLILGAGPAQTVIDGNHLDAVLSISPLRAVTIDGLTMRNGSSLSINRSTLRSNVADNGGAIAAFNDVSVRDSALYGNSATSDGGGIYNNGRLIVTNSTISGNAADTNGGGIYSRISAFIYNTSIVNNDADHDRDENGGIGGGVYADAGSRFVAVNSLFTSNTILDAPIANNCSGLLEVYGRNLLDEVDGCLFSGNGGISWDLVAGDSVGSLQDNGGPTFTHALLAGSDAIDAATAEGCIDQKGVALPTDQRGGPRVAGLRCDVGAFEFGDIAGRVFGNGFE